MITSKTIHVISATDAAQHLGKFKSILIKLKKAKRISSFKEHPAENFDTNSLNEIRSEDQVILLLTNSITSIKSSIKEHLLTLKRKQPSTKITKIFVENLPYEMKFIAFAADLAAIRTRLAMDCVSQGIDESLKSMFPATVTP